MIVTMNKVTLLVSIQDREQALETLQDLGVMHLSFAAVPEDGQVESARERLDTIRQLREMIPEDGPGEQDRQKSPPSFDVESLWQLVQQARRIRRDIEDLDKEIERIRPFGRFDPEAVRRLETSGVRVRLYETSVHSDPPVPEGVYRVETYRDKETVCFVLIGLIKPNLEIPEVPLPRASLESLRRKKKQLEDQEADLRRQFAGYAVFRSNLDAELEKARDWYDFVTARAGLVEHGPVLALEGFVPGKRLYRLQQSVVEQGWGVVVREVRPEDQPPTLLEHPAWVRPIKAVFEMIGVVPGYFETDISLPFLLFLSLFFAMIVGDAGYGALFIGGTLLAGRFFRVPDHAFRLMLVMSGCTVVWGLLNGNLFGLQALPAVLEPLQLDWLSGPGSERHLMLLCFIIGAIQLTLAHTWRLVLLLPQVRALAQLGWILVTWTMFFLARRLVLLEEFPGVMLYCLAGGLILIVVFMLPLSSIGRNWPEYVRLPLDLISSFVDLVSYIRLYAVGMATFAIASAFNGMAATIGLDGVFSGLAAAGIIFLGHGLNILLAGMGVLVHGVRLNTLEFAGHTGIQWTGTLFSPFARRHTTKGDEA
jgi:V/A-type H+-transporting ATPase subunit I